MSAWKRCTWCGRSKLNVRDGKCADCWKKADMAEQASQLNPGTPDYCARCQGREVRQHCTGTTPQGNHSCVWAICGSCGAYSGVILAELRWIPGKANNAA